MENMTYNMMYSGLRRQLRMFSILLLLAAIPGMAVADDSRDFFLTISRDDGYMLHKLLEHGIDPNLKEPTRGDTAMVLALHEHAMKAFAELINAPKIDLEKRSDNGDTALMVASFTDNLPAVKALLDKDVEVNTHGWAALHYAAASGDCDIIKLLLEKSAYIDAESPNKTTPIMMAARAGHAEAVKLLVEAGADLHLKNDQGLSAADFAAKSEHPEIAEVLHPKN